MGHTEPTDVDGLCPEELTGLSLGRPKESAVGLPAAWLLRALW